jgi:hypothetical protein
MQKTILFLILWVFAINLNAQFLQRFDKKPYTTEVDAAINSVKANTLTPEQFKTFISWSLAFMVDETIFALSYEDSTDIKFTPVKNENGDPMYKTAQKTRNVFLYRRDNNGWVKASDIIQSDYHNQQSLGLNPKTNSYDNAVLYSVLNNHTVEDSENAFGRVVKLGNGVVMMFVPTSFGDTRINTDNVPFTYNKVVIFMPKGDGTYNTSIFEPINKNTIEPELHADQNLIIKENGNSFKAEIWVIGENNLDKVKLFCTLNFKIENGKASYSGDYKMTQIR